MKSFKDDFPIFANNPDLVYLDSAATSHKPRVVSSAVNDFYERNTSAVHRGFYSLARVATERYESVRHTVSRFIGAESSDEIIFTSGTTAAINLIACSWAREVLKPGDIILLSDMEHHANLVPWQQVAMDSGAELKFIALDDDYCLDYRSAVLSTDVSRVKLVAVTHVSNVLGTINPVGEIKSFFPDAKVLVDAAQSVAHLPINVTQMGVDFLAFSAHKMFGPSGVGVLYVKNSLFRSMVPFMTGGHMINRVSRMGALWADAPACFEPGTPNIEGVIGLGAAIGYIESCGHEDILSYEHGLTDYLIEQLVSVGADIIGPAAKSRSSVVSFQIPRIHPHDMAELLGRRGIAVRAGHHCAQPLMDALGLPGTVRASLSIYNTTEDVDALTRGIVESRRVLGI